MTYPTIMPAITLDFANSQQLDPRVTFSRTQATGQATYINSAGQVAYAAEHEARFDHDPETGECLGLLIEESRTNNVVYSVPLTAGVGGWFVFGGWVHGQLTLNQAIAPDGTNNAVKYKPNASNEPCSALQYTGGLGWSIFVKKINCNKIQISAGGYNTCSYNFDTDTLDPGNSPSNWSYLKSEKYPNGWVRLMVGFKRTGGGANNPAVFISGIEADGYTFGNDAFYAWGLQSESIPSGDAVGFPTSYIPTSGSALVRSPDIAQVDTADIYGDQFTIINKPYGVSSGGSTLHLQGHPHVERAVVYNEYLSQEQINTVAGVDEFWRWRILGSSFALTSFQTDGQVTVDWGDGTVETLTTSAHTFTNGSGYHTIKLRLDSGTYFDPGPSDNTEQQKIIAVGPAPSSMLIAASRLFQNAYNLEAVDGTFDINPSNDLQMTFFQCLELKSMPFIDSSGVTNLQGAWRNCSSLTSFPLIDTSSTTVFQDTWRECSNLTNFPSIDTSAAIKLNAAWHTCSSLTSFPYINTSQNLNFTTAWINCSSLTSFPLIDTSSGTNFSRAWQSCSGLTSFPLIDTSSASDLSYGWYGCSGLTSFPAIDTSSATNFRDAWRVCSSLASFPVIDVSSGTSFYMTWRQCGFASFPALNFTSGNTFYYCWANNGNLVNFPAGCWDNWNPASVSNNVFDNAFDGCSSLSATSVENILNSIDTSGQSAPSTGVNIGIDYSTSTGTPNITTAVTNLKSRGWTITLNNVAQ